MLCPPNVVGGRISASVPWKRTEYIKVLVVVVIVQIILYESFVQKKICCNLEAAMCVNE